MVKLRPSSFPALSQCPKFEPGFSEYLGPGNVRHSALPKMFNGDPNALKGVPEDQADGLQWAVDYIRLKAPLSDYPVEFEKPVSIITADFEEIPGTADTACGRHLFDLKWRRKDYTAQMACYALARIQDGYKEVTVHVLYADSKTVEIIEFDEESASRIVEKVIANVKNPEATETPCDYCGWCARKVTCPTLNKMALTVANGREDWKLENYHPSEIEDPAQMAKALVLAGFLKKWAESVKFHALDMWKKKGIAIPDCELKERKGKRQASDLEAIFHAVGLEPKQFLACCEIRFATSVKDKTKIGLENAYAAAKGIPVEAAKRELKNKLEPFIKAAQPSLSVVPIKQTEELEGEE